MKPDSGAVLVVLDHEALSEPTVVGLDTVGAVARLDRGVRRQHCSQQAVEIAVAGAVERRPGSCSFAAGCVATKADSVEQHLTSLGVTRYLCNGAKLGQTPLLGGCAHAVQQVRRLADRYDLGAAGELAGLAAEGEMVCQLANP